MKRMFKAIIICFCLMPVLLAAYFIKDIFIVKNVNIEKNFELNNKKLLEFLGIEKDRFIWSYDTEEMEKKLSKDINLFLYKIEKKYPDSINIRLYRRAPLANICGTNNEVFFIDDMGAIFAKYGINYHIPLIILNKNINLSFNSQNSIAEVLVYLKEIRQKDRGLYDSISQIEISVKKNGLSDFIVNYRTINNRIYLKNSINADLLKRGLVCALYLTENGLSNRNILYSGAGFVF